MSTEAAQNRIVHALQANLAAIASDGGATYWYTPKAVLMAPFFSDAECLAPAAQHGGTVYALTGSPACAYFLVPATETRHADANKKVRCVVTLHIWAAILTGDDEGPWSKRQPNGYTLQGRLAADVKKRLDSGGQVVGGTVPSDIPSIRVNVTEDERGPEETWYPGWAVVRLTVETEFVHWRHDP